MADNYAQQMKRLAEQYFRGHLSTVEYRIQRRALIDSMDRKYNGFERESSQETGDTTKPNYFNN